MGNLQYLLVDKQRCFSSGQENFTIANFDLKKFFTGVNFGLTIVDFDPFSY